MAQSVTITIQNDAKAITLLDYFCKAHGYPSIVSNPAFDDEQPVDPQTNPLTIPNPETKKQFLKRYTIQWWRNEGERGQAKEDKQASLIKFNSDNIVID